MTTDHELRRDKERLDWLSWHDHWITENGLQVCTVRIETGRPADEEPMLLREAIDIAMERGRPTL